MTNVLPFKSRAVSREEAAYENMIRAWRKAQAEWDAAIQSGVVPTQTEAQTFADVTAKVEALVTDRDIRWGSE